MTGRPGPSAAAASMAAMSPVPKPDQQNSAATISARSPAPQTSANLGAARRASGRSG